MDTCFAGYRGGGIHMRKADFALAFAAEIEGFAWDLSVTDRVWNLVFPGERGKWHQLHVSKYRKTFFVTHVEGDLGCLEIEPGKGVRFADPMGFGYGHGNRDERRWPAWESLIARACRWLQVVRKDWVGAAKRVQFEYPLRYRYGVVPHAVVRACLPDIYRLDLELGPRKIQRIVRLVEEGHFNRDENTVAPTMTAGDFFDICKIAYIAGRRRDERVDKTMTGRQMYEQFADGRDDGLLEIDPSSSQEFADWIDGSHPKRDRGGHPWEIKRGGNTTHIDLAVFRPSPGCRKGFKIQLRGEALGRMAEVVCMLLAIHAAGWPISIADPENVRRRLLAQDNVGIVPAYASLHRSSAHFPREQHVFEVLAFDDLGRHKRRIAPFITWEPLPIMRPRVP